MLYCFGSRHIEVYVPLNRYKGAVEIVGIISEYFFKSYNVFNCLMISLGSKSAFNWSNTLHIFKK